ncbi:prepilin-type N-terminal cleavage/methylation domain-containing protein [Opitutaceae bacterium TAV1]|nr:prepilin-type N-terminal cleavage/methylation domain-containing protein [Opitutaceae bacterium TAV1]
MPPHYNIRQARGMTLIELLTVVTIIGILVAILIPVVGKMRASARQTQCTVNMRQLGIAVHLYVADNRQRLPYGYWTKKPEDGGGTTTWDGAITPYFGDTRKSSLQCPSDDLPISPPVRRRTYSMIRAGQGGVGKTGNLTEKAPSGVAISSLESLAQTAMFTERSSSKATGQSSDNYIGGSAACVIDSPKNQVNEGKGLSLHGGRFNYLFVDGHVKSYRPEETIGTGTMDAPKGIWTIASGD